MIKIDTEEASKENLDYFLVLAKEKGESVVFYKGDIKVAELKLEKEKKPKRILGQGKGEGIVTDEFFEPMPEEFMKHFT